MNQKKPDWNPDLYLKFNNERLQPSIDLVSRIDLKNPQLILDVGCGPGNSTQVLVQRWPKAAVTGLDNSPAMIEKAKADYPGQSWILCDAGQDVIPGVYDLVFSNATIQWIPDHAVLLKKFSGLLNENGMLAVQVPMFWDMPIGQAIKGIAEDRRWTAPVHEVKHLFTMNTFSFYYDLLSTLFGSHAIWETQYMHEMESHAAILEMIRSTGLKPYLERLEGTAEKAAFEEAVLQHLQLDYPEQRNKKIIFPFKRLFFTARK